eukprot:CAMPEP_0179473034 /NCGR_PEP_ID=MMETSP0799-20121207/52879_1 /TAXON_ID=46947 /ORGANISM="Geminigera cryophila, Strain CCMP2564" /LENGTH=244 /DNA_ID=CAMNT_0021281471 /DNA_START=180 /DNA_END=911 /DNA_ORIENTATION=+
MDVSGANADARVRAVTEAWVQEWVVGLRLCPWATLTKGHSSKGMPYTRIVTLHGGEEQLDALAATVVREASVMRQVAQKSGDSNSAFFTTLLVFPHASFAGHNGSETGNPKCGAFPTLVRQAQGLLIDDPDPQRMDLLAFHRRRVDEGPGTSPDFDDAAHFSVRSPYPTLQLLREKDLVWARSQWQQQQAQNGPTTTKNGPSAGPGAPRQKNGPSAGPGALGLLMANKQRLRGMGSAALKRTMD